MRHDAPFVVKRLAPPIGRAGGARRITLHGHGYTLDEAIDIARDPARRRQTLESMRERDGDPHGWMTTKIGELARTSTWIEKRGARATTTPGGRGA